MQLEQLRALTTAGQQRSGRPGVGMGAGMGLVPAWNDADAARRK